jgi:hypothetical protein
MIVKDGVCTTGCYFGSNFPVRVLQQQVDMINIATGIMLLLQKLKLGHFGIQPTCTCTCMCMFACIYMYIYIHVRVYTCIYIYI